MDILNLPSLKTLSVSDDGGVYSISAEPAALPSCPHCGGALVGFGRRPQNYADLPMHGKQTIIRVDRRRWRCKDCQKVSVDALPDMDEKREATRRLVSFVRAQSLSRKFTDVAREVGVGEQTVRNIFDDYVAELDARDTFATPRVLGIDEIHLLGQARCILTNIEEGTAIDLLPKRTKDLVYRRLLALENRERVEIVTMDMWPAYRDAARAALPHAAIVIDKFHVVRMASVALEQVRKAIRQTLPDKTRRTMMHDRFILLRRNHALNAQQRLVLDVWLGAYPALADAYQIKESIYNLFDAPFSPEGARARYRDIRSCVTTDIAAAFKPLTTAFENWDKEIFAYFEHRVTNAMTEALNGLTAKTNSDGRGYSFDVIRAKVLHTPREQKRNRKTNYGVNVARFVGDYDELAADFDRFIGQYASTSDEQITAELESGKSTSYYG